MLIHYTVSNLILETLLEKELLGQEVCEIEGL